MIKTFGKFRKRNILFFLIVLFLPFPVYAGGKKDDGGQKAAPVTENESSYVSDESIIPDTGPQFVSEGEISQDDVSGQEPGEDVPEDDLPSDDLELTAEEAAAAEKIKVTEMDIRTSTFSELADWCRSLGLSEGGTKAQLDARLREYYGIGAAAASIPRADGEAGKQKTIVIESARTTEYFTLEVVDEDYARLEGNVVISLKDGNDIHRIKAWEIVYNRTRNTMTAKGGVEYQKESGDTIESFKGNSLTINLDTFAGVFTGGASERSMANEGLPAPDGEAVAAYRFEGSVISQSGDDVTVLQDAVVTNAKNKENYWSISASKIWLLPGSDFAIFNAVLKVGEIPVLYIPFFFLPADEIVFHPVIGTRSREGLFVQTTTYILGRPRASETTEQSITSLLGGASDMERTRNGLFLRSTGVKSRDPNDTRLSVLFDAYTNLGMYLGTELELPKTGILNNLNLSFGIGLTRDVHLESEGFYTPFAPDYDGTSNWNRSNLFSLDFPLRYRLKTSGEISGSAGKLAWDIPFYSDPFVEIDFMNRSEVMDLMSLLENTPEEELNNEILNSYEMRLTGSSSPKVDALNPYISRINISNISSFLSLKTRSNPDPASSVSPQRVFFYPDKLTLLSLSASVSGTPFTSGNASAWEESDEIEKADADKLLRSFGVPRSPWGEIPVEEDTEKRTPSLDDLVPPALNQSFTIPSPANWPVLTLGYTFNPSGAVEMQYNSSAANWKKIEDVKWDDLSSILSLVRLNGRIDFSAKDPFDYYTLNFGLSGDSSWRGYSYMNEESEEFDSQSEIDNAEEMNNRSNFMSGSSELTASVRPFPQHAVWGNSNVKYTLKNLLAKTEYSGTPGDPDWKVVKASWDEDGIETHKFTTNVAATVWEKNQSFVLDADLPPRESALSTTANLRFWLSETYINGKIRSPFKDHTVFDPYTFTETLRFNTNDFLRYSMVYDPQNDQITSITAGLGFKGFTSSYSMEYMTPYEFNENPAGWVLSGDKKELVPKDFSLGYEKVFSWDNLWKNRLSFSIDVGTDIKFDLQRYTYSSLNFDFGVTLKIKDILDISFSAQSANSVIYRYVQDLPFFSLPITIPGEKNIFVDLINSFRFDDESLRKNSGFKLRQLSFALTHYMGDWNMNLNVNLAPYLDTNSRSYKFNTEIAFLIKWLPISEIKSEIKYDKDNFNIR